MVLCLVPFFSFENRVVDEIMSKNVVQAAGNMAHARCMLGK
jgi:hypothetical protein